MIIQIILLSISAVIWGFGFIAARWTLVSFDPYWTTAMRFIVAGSLSLPFLFYKKSFWRKNNIIVKSAISSLFLFGTLLFQTMGLQRTTVAKSGFITTLYALFIPLILMIFARKKYRLTFWLLVVMALIGMALMCNLEIRDLNLGDFLTLLCSLCASLHIMYIGKVANHIESPIEFNFLQNVFVGFFSVITAFFIKGIIDFNPLIQGNFLELKGILFLGIVSSLISFTIQVIAQKKIPSHIAGLIFLMESPCAAVFGFFIFKEILSTLNILGAILIIISVLLIPILGREVTTTQQGGIVTS